MYVLHHAPLCFLASRWEHLKKCCSTRGRHDHLANLVWNRNILFCESKIAELSVLVGDYETSVQYFERVGYKTIGTTTQWMRGVSQFLNAGICLLILGVRSPPEAGLVTLPFGCTGAFHPPLCLPPFAKRKALPSPLLSSLWSQHQFLVSGVIFRLGYKASIFVDFVIFRLQHSRWQSGLTKGLFSRELMKLKMPFNDTLWLGSAKQQNEFSCRYTPSTTSPSLESSFPRLLPSVWLHLFIFPPDVSPPRYPLPCLCIARPGLFWLHEMVFIKLTCVGFRTWFYHVDI